MGIRDLIGRIIKPKPKKEEAGRISLPSEGSRSPSENILIGGGGTVAEVMKAATQSGGSFSGGGSGGGGGSQAQAQAQAEAQAKAQAQAQAEAQAKLEAQRKAQAEAQAKLEATRTQEALRDKQLDQMRRQGQERIDAQRQAVETEQRRVEQERVDILREGGQKRVQEFTQKETGRKVEHTTTTGSGGRRVFEVKDVDTGKTISTRTYAPTKESRGKVVQTGGIIITETKPVVAEKSIITGSEDIFFKDGKTRIIKDTKDIKAVPYDFIGAIQKDTIRMPKVDETIKEIYSSELGGFVKSDVRGQYLDITPEVRQPTIEEQRLIDRTTGEKVKDALKTYETKVVMPISNVLVSGAKKYKEKVVEPLSKVLVSGAGALVSGVKLYEEKVVRPTSRVLVSGFGLTKTGLKKYEEKVVRPTSKVLVSGVGAIGTGASYIKEQAKDVVKTTLVLKDIAKEKAKPYVIAGIGAGLTLAEKEEGIIKKTIITPAKDTFKTMFALKDIAKEKAKPYVIAGLVSQARLTTNIEKGIKSGVKLYEEKVVRPTSRALVSGISYLGEQAKDITKTTLVLKDIAKEKAKPYIVTGAIAGLTLVKKEEEMIKSGLKKYEEKVVFPTSRALVSGVKLYEEKVVRQVEDITGISDIKKIRQLNIEAKKQGKETFQFMSPYGIQEVPTARTWLGASLGVAGKGAEVFSYESGLAEARLKFRKETERPYISDMAEGFPYEYKPRKGEVKQEAKKIVEDIAFLGKAGTVGGAFLVNPSLGYASTGILFNKEIVTNIGKGVDYIAPPITKKIEVTKESKDEFGNIIYTTETQEVGTGFAREGAGRQILRGALYGASILVPGVGYAYGTQIVSGLATAPRVTIGGITTFARQNPYEFGAMLSTGKIIKSVKVGVTKLSPEYKRVETSSIGEKIIKGVKGKEGEFDIGIIPERGSKLNINPVEFAKEYKGDIKLVESPNLPKFTGLEKIAIDVAKKEGGVYVGSGAAKVLIKGTRTGMDVDIVSKNPLKTAKLIAKESGEGTKINPHKVNGIDVVAVVDKYGNKIDIVSQKGYKSVSSLFGFGSLKTVEVEGLKILSPESLLKKKAEVIYDVGLVAKKSPKTIADIKAYTGGKVDIDIKKATLTGPYGYTKQELGSYTGKTVTVTHASTGLFGLFKKQVDIMAQPDNPTYGLFASPPDIKTGMVMARASRLGAEATIRDLLTGKATIGKPSSKPQIVVFEKQKIGVGENFYVPFKSTELETVTPLVDLAGKPLAIKKIGSGGVTVINKERVGIILSEFVKEGDLSKTTLNLIEQSKQGKLSPSETIELQGRLIKETGVDYSGDKLYFDPQRLIPKITITKPQETISTIIKPEISISPVSLNVKPSELSKVSIISSISRPSSTRGSRVSSVSSISSVSSVSSRPSSIQSKKSPSVSSISSRASSLVSRMSSSSVSKLSSKASSSTSEISKKTTSKPLSSLSKRILAKAREEPGIWEAVGIRFGKEVKLGKGTKKVTSKKLSKFLSETLGASGYLKTKTGKVKSIETGLLSKPSFRKSKVSEFLVVERKEKRLKKTAPEETKEIQYFRTKTKKSKKKNLFGL